MTVCIDKSPSESDCHARPFNPPPPQTGFGRALLYTLQSLNWILIMARCGKRKESQKERIHVSSCLLKITGHLKHPTSVSCHHHVATCRSGKHYELYLHIICSKIMCQECHMGRRFSTVEEIILFEESGIKWNCLLFWVGLLYLPWEV